MLLTVFKTQESRKLPLNYVNAQRINDNNYFIKFESDLSSEDIEGIILQKSNHTLLVWKTYDAELATKMTSKLRERLQSPLVFEPYIFPHELFLSWLNISSQFIECGFESDILGEKRIAGFDLKKSEKFKDLINKIKIKMAVFTLEGQNVLITARREGKISITPDVTTEKLISILDVLLTNGITMVANG